MKFIKPTLALALVSTIVMGLAQQQPPDPEVYRGKPLPKFTMKDTTGKTITNASLKGKVVLIDFWATWCGPCKKASPLMQDLHKRYAKKGLVVLGANVNDSAGAAPKYKKEHGYTYTFTTGGEKLLEKIGFTGIPGFLFVDKKGIIQKVQLGYGEQFNDDMENAVRKLLAS